MTSTLDLNSESVEAFREFDPSGGRLGVHGSVREAEVFSELVSGRTCLLDIGAHFGFFSLRFAIRTGGVAYAMEPSSMAFAILRDNADRNPTLNVVPVRMFAGAERKLVGCRFSVAQAIAGGDEATFSAVPIDALCLRPDCVKIDVEGYELEVLRGAERTLNIARPMIFLEVHPQELGTMGHSTEDLMEELKRLGYTVADYDGRTMADLPDKNAHVLCLP